MATIVDRLLPTEEAEELLALTRDLAAKELAPQVAELEAAARSRRRRTGCRRTGLLACRSRRSTAAGPAVRGLPAGVEEIAAAWPSVGVGTSVHTLTATVVAANGTPSCSARWLPQMLSGDWLGAYCLSEPQAGSDVSGIKTRAVRDGDEYVVTGTKQWISNGSCADYYILFARTSDDPERGLSAFVVPADTAGMGFGAPEKKMGLACDVTTQVLFDGARIPADQLIGEEGAGMQVALSALDAGRLGIAAVATGIAQAALAHAVAYAGERRAVRPADRRLPGAAVPARRHGGRGRAGPRDVPPRGAAQGRRPPLLPPGHDRQADRDRRGDAGDHRRRAGARRQRLHPRVPRRAALPRRQGHPDLRGHQPDPAHGHWPRPPAPALSGSG